MKEVQPGNPIHTLRARVIKTAAGGHRFEKIYLAAIMVKAWNAWYDHKTLKVLKWRTEQNPDESFPAVSSTFGLAQI